MDINDWKKEMLYAFGRPGKVNNKIEFKKNGKLHNIEFPALISYYENGNICVLSYYKEGKLHRKNGSAYITYYRNGNIMYNNYYKEGKLYRKNGPAWILYLLK